MIHLASLQQNAFRRGHPLDHSRESPLKPSREPIGVANDITNCGGSEQKIKRREVNSQDVNLHVGAGWCLI